MEELKIIRIRFASISFDKITKDVSANLIDKLSHFGGTAGLFNGFSIISVFEILVFILTLLINLINKACRKGCCVHFFGGYKLQQLH